MSDSEEASFDLGLPPVTQEHGGAYRVLARKYRPQRFSELIGQDAMVQTLGNAIKRDRLAHAFLMTGVRGVGKTSTARLVAKALNCEHGPTIDPCGVCDPCVSIAEGRHMDVVEMDAASNTGVDDVREIIESVRYAAVSARYKVYIIDEVHMLSKNAFNALLKTLEEPPPHVKFLFATTEVQKVPITVLSRCQRFDLRRISAEQLAKHFAHVAREEKVAVDEEALALIARAAEGSARDGLSILDQAIAHADMEGANVEGGGRVSADQVRAMLGLSDRGAIRTLFDQILKADAPAALQSLRDQFDLGVDPAAVFKGLIETCHGAALVKAGGAPDPSQSNEEREALEGWASGMSFALFHRLWQLLLKGHGEVIHAVDPRMAADMAVLRIVHAGQMPDPTDLIKKLESGAFMAAAGAVSAGPSGSSAPQATAQNAVIPNSYEGVIETLEAEGKHLMGDELRREFGLVSFKEGVIGIRPLRPQPDANFLAKYNAVLRDVFGPGLRFEVTDGHAAPSLEAQKQADENAARDAILSTPIVRATFEAFPEAALLDEDPLKGAVG
jgi:DNA polymerase III subunit gamma/tau